MYGFILGFHLLVWCPKCTPASNNCFIEITLIFSTSMVKIFCRYQLFGPPELRHHANYQPACIFVLRTHAIDIVTQKKSAFKHFFLYIYLFFCFFLCISHFHALDNVRNAGNRKQQVANSKLTPEYRFFFCILQDRKHTLITVRE